MYRFFANEVKLADLQKVKEEATISKPKTNSIAHKGKVSYNLQKTQTISTEVDVRGLMVDEAWPVVDKYLDDAYLSGLKQVTIIHGKEQELLEQLLCKR